MSPRRRTRVPEGEPEQNLSFWTGKNILQNSIQGEFADKILEIAELKEHKVTIETGVVTVKNVPLSEIDRVRKALEGLEILPNLPTLREKKD